MTGEIEFVEKSHRPVAEQKIRAEGMPAREATDKFDGQNSLLGHLSDGGDSIEVGEARCVGEIAQGAGGIIERMTRVAERGTRTPKSTPARPGPVGVTHRSGWSVLARRVMSSKPDVAVQKTGRRGCRRRSAPRRHDGSPRRHVPPTGLGSEGQMNVAMMTPRTVKLLAA